MACIGEIGDEQAPTKKLKLYDGHVSPAESKTLFECPINSDTDDDSTFEENEEARAEYKLKIKTSGGFDVDEVKGYVGLIFAMDLEAQPGIYLVVKELSQMAIDMYNKDNGTNYKVVDIVKVNTQMAGGFKHYITFEASDVAKDVGVKIFQAIGWELVSNKKTRAKNLVVDFCKVKGT